MSDPPEPSEPPIELEAEWQREKAAKQEAARRPPPKPPLKIIGVIVAVLLMAGAAVGIVYITKREPTSAGGSDRVRIEIRAMPVAKIRLNNRELGSTPITVIKPRSKTAFTIEATMRTYGMSNTGHSMNQEFKVTRSIVPDHDQTVDIKPEGRGTLVPATER